MLSKRTIIGIVVGSAIIAIGLYSLVSSLGLQSIEIDETFGIGETTSYRFTAPENAAQSLNITANSFQLSLKSPRGGLQIPETDYKEELLVQWIHLEDGQSSMKIKNTGDSEMNIKGTLEYLTDPIQVTYHFVVIIAGVVIIGFSAGFTMRKPRGF